MLWTLRSDDDGQSYSQTVDLYVEKSPKPGAKISQDFNKIMTVEKNFSCVQRVFQRIV